MFKDYLMTNLKLYFERFEEELQADLPEPDIKSPADIGASEATPGNEIYLDAEEMLEWLVLESITK